MQLVSITSPETGFDPDPDEPNSILHEIHARWMQNYPEGTTGAVERSLIEAGQGETTRMDFYPVRSDSEGFRGMFLLANFEPGHHVSVHWYAHPDWLGKPWLRVEDMQDVFAYCFETLGVKVVLGIVNESNPKATQACEKMGFERSGTTVDVDGHEFEYIYVTPDRLKPVLREKLSWHPQPPR